MKNALFKLPVTNIKKGQKNYPKELLDLVDPPLFLNIRGTFDSSVFSNCVAVVGSRKMTRYGEEVVESFVTTLALKGVTIISGFMYGVDTAAHKAAIAAQGKTIAVLAHGLDYIYPPENEELYKKIIDSGGFLISEYPNDFRPQLWTYPKRNRIVAALSKKGVLVVEAAHESGSLITASYADALNRPLFAVPGSVFSKTSAGTNRLIKDGIAQSVLSADDIVPSIVSLNRSIPTLFEDFSKLETAILDILSCEDMGIDEISMKLKQSVVEVGSTLSVLCLKGVVKDFGGKYSFKKTPN